MDRVPGPDSCNMCRNGATALGRPCTNGCAYHVFDDGSVLSNRYVRIRESGEPNGFGDVWSHRLMRGWRTGPRHHEFRLKDGSWYGPDLQKIND